MSRREILLGLASLIATAAAYHLITSSGFVNTNVFPTAEKIMDAFGAWYRSGQLLTDIKDSLFRVLAGYVAGAFLAVCAAVVLSTSNTMYSLFRPHLEFLRNISPLAWIPFAILVFKLGDRPAIFLVAVASFFPIFTSTYHGIRSTKTNLLETADMFGASAWQKILAIYLPSSMPYILNGMKISLGIAWYVVVAAEMIGSQTGLGYTIQASKLTLQTEYIMASILVIGSAGIILNAILSQLEKKLTSWAQS